MWQQHQQVQQMQQEKEPQMEHRIIGGIQEGDECPECNEKLVVSPFSKITSLTSKLILSFLEYPPILCLVPLISCNC